MSMAQHKNLKIFVSLLITLTILRQGWDVSTKIERVKRVKGKRKNIRKTDRSDRWEKGVMGGVLQTGGRKWMRN